MQGYNTLQCLCVLTEGQGKSIQIAVGYITVETKASNSMCDPIALGLQVKSTRDLASKQLLSSLGEFPSILVRELSVGKMLQCHASKDLEIVADVALMHSSTISLHDCSAIHLRLQRQLQRCSALLEHYFVGSKMQLAAHISNKIFTLRSFLPPTGVKRKQVMSHSSFNRLISSLPAK